MEFLGDYLDQHFGLNGVATLDSGINKRNNRTLLDNKSCIQDTGLDMIFHVRSIRSDTRPLGKEGILILE